MAVARIVGFLAVDYHAEDGLVGGLEAVLDGFELGDFDLVRSDYQEQAVGEFAGKTWGILGDDRLPAALLGEEGLDFGVAFLAEAPGRD
jgi:hypothetical protein